VRRKFKWKISGVQDEEFTDCLREYMALGEAFYIAMTFKKFTPSNILSGISPN